MIESDPSAATPAPAPAPAAAPAAAPTKLSAKDKFKGKGLAAGLSLGAAAAPPPTNDHLVNILGEENLGKIAYNDAILRCSDLVEVSTLGSGAFGTVLLMKHRPSEALFAVKKIRDSMVKEERAQLLTDLTVIRSSNHKHIVKFYGVNFTEGTMWIVMEHMRASLDKVYPLVKSKGQHMPEEVLGVIAVSVLEGLSHLYHSEKHIMHRDVKPSNILLGFDGIIKLCDFGISKQMGANKQASTYVGCAPYFPPERLDPNVKAYDGTNDVWAYGLTLAELAALSFPYPVDPKDRDRAYDLMSCILDDPAPTVDATRYSAEFCSYVAYCLEKDFRNRPLYQTGPANHPDKPALLNHPFIVKHQQAVMNVHEWAASLYESVAPVSS